MKSDEIYAAKVESKRLVQEYSIIRPDVEVLQQRYLSLSGLHSWYPISVDGNMMSFSSIGKSRNVSTVLSYDLVKPDDIAVRVSLQAKGPRKLSSRKFHSSISAFLDAYVKSFANTVNTEKLTSSFEITEHMQKYTWVMGRLEQTANELQSLRKRYKARLSRTAEKNFIVSIDFRGRSSKLVADFEIEASYPTLPLEVRLDLLQGSLDLENLKKSLMRNAKPGFGNLARACDVIAASVV